MSMSNGSPSEMPNLPRFSTRQLPDAACAEGLLVGRGVAPGAPVGQQALARMLAIAASPATDRELAGEAAAVAAFARVTSYPGSRHPGARPRTVPASRRLARLTLALAACVTALGGTAAAVGALPAPIQEVAHVTFGAPAPHHSVPVPLPIGGSSRQPGNNEIQATGQPGHQKAGPPGNPSGQPPGDAPGRLPRPPDRLVTSWRDVGLRSPRRPASCRGQRCQAPAAEPGSWFRRRYSPSPPGGRLFATRAPASPASTRHRFP